MDSKLRETFEVQYPDLKIKEIRPYKDGKKFVIADAKDGSVVMDPFFIYNTTTNEFNSYNPMANFNEFTQLMKGCQPSF